MKTIILILSLIPCALNAQWRSTHTANRPLTMFAHDTELFVSWSGRGVWYYLQTQQRWVRADSGILPGDDDKQVKSFASTGSYLFVGGPGVQYSTDNGASWTLRKSTMFWGEASPIATIDTFLFANNGLSLQRSTDYGNTWSSVIPVRILSFARMGPLMLAGGYNSFWRSEDRGVSWVKVIDAGVGDMTAVGTDLFAWG